MRARNLYTLCLLFLAFFVSAQAPRLMIPKSNIGEITDVDISPDGRYVATLTEHYVILWQASTAQQLYSISCKTKREDAKIRFSPDGTSFLIYSRGNSSPPEVEVRRTSDGQVLFSLNAPFINFANFTPDGKYLVTANISGEINIYAAATGIFYKTSKAFSEAPASNQKFDADAPLPDHSINNLAFSKNGKFIVTANSDQTAQTIEILTGKTILFKGHTDKVNDAEFSPDAKSIVTASDDGTIKVWNTSTGKPLFQQNIGGHVKIAMFFPGSAGNTEKYILVMGEGDSFKPEIRNASTGELIKALDLIHNDTANTTVRFSADGRYIIFTDPESGINIIDAHTFESVQGMGEYAKAAGVSVDGKYIATLRSADAAILWQLPDLKPLEEFKGYDKSYIAIKFLKNGLLEFKDENDQFKTLDLYTGAINEIAKDQELPPVYKWKSVGSGTLLPDSALISIDGKYFVQNNDGSIFDLFNMKSQKQLLKYILLNNGNCIRITPEGYYQAPKNDISEVYYVTSDLKIISFDQFDIKYNRPDKVLEILSPKNTAMISSYKNAYQLRVERLQTDTGKIQNEGQIPVLKILNREKIEKDNENGAITNHVIKLAIRAGSPGSALESLAISVNGVPVFGTKGIRLDKRNKTVIDTTISIELSPGQNKIEAWVINKNKLQSNVEPLTVKGTGNTKYFGRTFFIGIGVNTYKDTTQNLKWSVNDIHGLAKALKWRCGEDISIDTFFNQNVTRENIDAIKLKLKSLTENDRVIIAYSGHGLLGSADKKLFLATVDVDFLHPEKAGIPYNDFENLLDDIKPRQKLMLIDACNSGDYYKSYNKNMSDNSKADPTKQNSFETMRDAFVNLERSTGATIIAATGSSEPSGELDSLQHGIFMYCVLESFYNYDNYVHFITYDAHQKYDNNPYTVNALKEYLMKRVPELSLNAQQPIIRSENINFDWTLWHL